MVADKEWCDKVAILSADALVDAKLIKKEEVLLAAAVIAEELLVRLSLSDCPAPTH